MRRLTMKKVIGVALSLAVAMAAGCGGKKGEGPKPAAKQAKETAGKAVSPAEEIKVEKEVYVYDSKGRRDPFLSLVVVAKERPQKMKKVNPMENYDVEEINLSAIVWDNKQHYALVTLPDNKSYTLRKGMTLGLYGGKVADITKDSVLIREQIKDYRGQPKTKDTILRLRKEEEE